MPTGTYNRNKDNKGWFKKGFIPWNKDKKGLQIGWLKGKHLSEKHKENLSNAKKGKIPLCVFTRRSYKGKNNPMYGVHRFGEKSPSWRGGRVKDKYGYILIYKPNHPFAMYKKYVYEHRLIIEKQIGRYLKSTEIVHHINSNCSDNRIENLKLFSSNIEHLNYHKYLK